MGKRREVYDEGQAAGRLRVPLAAWRWAAGTGLVPAADAGPGQWSRAVVESVDAELVRAALRGPVGAGWAADRLTEALGVPLPLRRPRVTASAVGHLVRSGLLVWLGGEVEFPEVHPDQVAALARRRDLPALLDRHVPLGPDQAAARLGVRRTDYDQVVRLGYVSAVGSVEIDYKRHGGVTTVPLYSAEEVALVPFVRRSVDWRQVYRTGPGRRSLLAGLAPVVPGEDTVLLAEVGRIAGVGRAAVVNWRRRLPGFPAPVGGTDASPVFDRRAVVDWLLAHGKLTVPSVAPAATVTVLGAGGRTRTVRVDDPSLLLADDAEGVDRVSGWAVEADADALGALGEGACGMTVRRLTAPGFAPLAVMGDVRVSGRDRASGGRAYLELSWPARVRGTAGSASGVVRHGVTYAGVGEECRCTRQDCGGIVPAAWCPEHGGSAAPRMEWHPGGGIRCTALARGRTRLAVSR